MTSFPTSDFYHQVTWDDLDALFQKWGVKDYYADVHEKVQRWFGCKLLVIGTRYYLVFPVVDDFILFKLRYM